MTDSRSGFGSLHMPRSRGAVSGLLLLTLGAWGALIPFIGPVLSFRLPARPSLGVEHGTSLAGGVSRSRHRGGRVFAVDLREPRDRHVRRLARSDRRRLVCRRPHAGVDTAPRRRRPAHRGDGRQARGHRDRILLRAGRAHRLLRWGGPGASDDPDGARCGVGPRAAELPVAVDSGTSDAFAEAARTEALTPARPTPPARKARAACSGAQRRRDEPLTTRETMKPIATS